jgi:hypothetical protein
VRGRLGGGPGRLWPPPRRPGRTFCGRGLAQGRAVCAGDARFPSGDGASAGETPASPTETAREPAGGDGASSRGCDVCEGEAARVTKTPRSQGAFTQAVASVVRLARMASKTNHARRNSCAFVSLRPPRSRCVDLVPYRGPKVMSRVRDRGEVVNFTTSPSHPPRRSRRLRDGRPPRCASRHGRCPHGNRPSPVPRAVPPETRPSRRRPQPARAAAEMAGSLPVPPGHPPSLPIPRAFLPPAPPPPRHRSSRRWRAREVQAPAR